MQHEEWDGKGGTGKSGKWGAGDNQCRCTAFSGSRRRAQSLRKETNLAATPVSEETNPAAALVSEEEESSGEVICGVSSHQLAHAPAKTTGVAPQPLTVK